MSQERENTSPQASHGESISRAPLPGESSFKEGEQGNFAGVPNAQL